MFGERLRAELIQLAQHTQHAVYLQVGLFVRSNDSAPTPNNRQRGSRRADAPPGVVVAMVSTLLRPEALRRRRECGQRLGVTHAPAFAVLPLR